MNLAGGLSARITRVTVGRNLPQGAVRRRLTLLYGGLFLISGAALMAITYALLVNAGFVFTLGGGSTPQQFTPQAPLAQGRARVGPPAPGTRTDPSAETLAYWGRVSQCMRGNGVASFPKPRDSVPTKFANVGEVSDRDGAILVFPAAINMRSAVFLRAASACGFADDSEEQLAQTDRGRTHTRRVLLLQSGIALAGMSLLSLGLGWLVAGRVLQPLEDSYDAQRQFVANASHERLRAPLTRLRALSEVALASSDANAGSLRNAHERVLASEQQLEEMIDALLALTRAQAGLERRERLDLAAVAAQALHLREEECDARHLDVRATLDSATTVGDPRLIARLVANLIDNAVCHNSDGGCVEVTTATRDRRAVLVVANTGPAVPSEEIHRLLQPFQRLGTARTTHSGGHGLGLSIVQAIASAHRAELSAKARPEGGLTIEVSFTPLPTSGSRDRKSTASAGRRQATRRRLRYFWG